MIFKGNMDLDATQWSWKIADDILQPVYTEEPLVPEEILQQISCNCSTGCKSYNCSCKKNFLKCTDVCKQCDTAHCENFEKIVFEEEPAENILDFFEDLECFENEEDEENNLHKKRRIGVE